MTKSNFPAVARQKQEIVRLLKKADYDDKTVTLMHRNLGASDHWQGKPVSHWLDSLSIAEASRLITKLRDEADEADDDED